jgi:hypothetical protein
MKATHTIKNVPVGFMTLKFSFDSFHLECAVIAIFLRGIKPNKGLIKEEIKNMLRSGGSDGAVDWIHENDYEAYIEKARAFTQKNYPTFYKSDK